MRDELGVDHLAVLKSMIVKKDSIENRAMRGCCYEINRSREEILALRDAIEVLIAAFCPGDDWRGVFVRDHADAALGFCGLKNDLP
jgi:hypothetical protein